MVILCRIQASIFPLSSRLVSTNDSSKTLSKTEIGIGSGEEVERFLDRGSVETFLGCGLGDRSAG